VERVGRGEAGTARGGLVAQMDGTPALSGCSDSTWTATQRTPIACRPVNQWNRKTSNKGDVCSEQCVHIEWNGIHVLKPSGSRCARHDQQSRTIAQR
jgi:hypothetical protein